MLAKQVLQVVVHLSALFAHCAGGRKQAKKFNVEEMFAEARRTAQERSRGALSW